MKTTTENGFERLVRLWPEIAKTKYPNNPELRKANSTRKDALDHYNEADTGSFFIGFADSLDFAALAYIVEAARHMCGMDHAGALRLLKAAIKDIEEEVK